MAYKIYQKLQSGMAGQGLIDAKDVDGASLCWHAEQNNASQAGAMTATVEDFKLADGAIVFFTLKYDTLAGTTLNISGTGSKPLYWHGSDVREAGTFKALDVLLLQYRAESGGRYYVLGVNLDTPPESVTKDTAIDPESPSETNVPTSSAVFTLINMLYTALNQSITTVSNSIGLLRSLTTTAKDNLVAAINEIVTALGSKQDALSTAQMNAVNSGITQSKRIQYDDYASGKQNTLTTAQMNAVNSGIDADKVAQYDGVFVTRLTLPLRRKKHFQFNANSEELTLEHQGTRSGFASRSFILNAPADISIINPNSNYHYYLAIRQGTKWILATALGKRVHIHCTLDDFAAWEDGEDEGNGAIAGNSNESSGSSEPTYWSEIGERNVYLHIGSEVAVLVIDVDEYDGEILSLTDADRTAIGSVTVEMKCESIKEALALAHQDEHRYVQKMTADGTLYRAKKVDDTYYVVPVAHADNTYDLYAALVPYNYFDCPNYLTVGTNAFASKASTYANDGKVDVITTGELYEYSLSEFFIIGDLPSLDYLYLTEKTISEALADLRAEYQQADTALGARIDTIDFAQYARCRWTVYDTQALLETYGLEEGATITGTNNHWFLGTININANTGNQLFDLRKLPSTLVADIQVTLTALSPYETIVYYRAEDDIRHGATTPLDVTDLRTVGEKPTQVTGKEYALHIRYDTVWWEELTPVTIQPGDE